MERFPACQPADILLPTEVLGIMREREFSSMRVITDAFLEKTFVEVPLPEPAQLAHNVETTSIQR